MANNKIDSLTPQQVRKRETAQIDRSDIHQKQQKPKKQTKPVNPPAKKQPKE